MEAPVVASVACEEQDERALVAAARRDPDAFAALYQQHYQAIARYVFRRTGDTHATEDLVADVFVSALRGLGIFRWRGISLRFWLYRIATNAVSRWARRGRREATRLRDFATASAARGDGTGASSGEWEERRIREALLSLSPARQAVVTLHHLEGLSIEDTAAIVGCRVGTVKSRLARGRDDLRAALSNRR